MEAPLQLDRPARKWAHPAISEKTKPSSHSDRLAKERRLANAIPKSQNEISRQVAATYRSPCSRVPVVARARSPAKRTAPPSLGKIRPAKDCKIGSTFEIRTRLEGSHQHRAESDTFDTSRLFQLESTKRLELAAITRNAGDEPTRCLKVHGGDHHTVLVIGRYGTGNCQLGRKFSRWKRPQNNKCVIGIGSRDRLPNRIGGVCVATTSDKSRAKMPEGWRPSVRTKVTNG